ncbi:Pyridoxine/pyridoxamine 5'-phosphate oxidase [Gorgonomyces haynaldii]|nr:Pyridoxine/pyridoxamine 5'-phosphate oxidase [Gorgonomyces haynaldii]
MALYTPRNIAALRVNYQKGELIESAIPKNPFKLFEQWFDEHIRFVMDNNQYPEPNAVSLATCDPVTLKPSCRVVLLKHLDDKGFIFYTNYDSRKGNELKRNPYAAMTFYWDERSVRVEGKVERVDDQTSTEYFQSRPLKSQLGAWSSQQSTVIPDRDTLAKQFEDYEKKFENLEKLPKPEFWGLALVPEAIEFWQGRRNRLHDRIKFVKSDQEWTISRLSP